MSQKEECVVGVYGGWLFPQATNIVSSLRKQR